LPPAMQLCSFCAAVAAGQSFLAAEQRPERPLPAHRHLLKIRNTPWYTTSAITASSIDAGRLNAWPARNPFANMTVSQTK